MCERREQEQIDQLARVEAMLQQDSAEQDGVCGEVRHAVGRRGFDLNMPNCNVDEIHTFQDDGGQCLEEGNLNKEADCNAAVMLNSAFAGDPTDSNMQTGCNTLIGGRLGTEDTVSGDEPVTDDILTAEPPTEEELLMDKMFDETNYATLDEIENATEPEIGMCFRSRDEAYNFFRVYARKMGFAIRKHSTFTSRVTLEVDKQVFVCNRQGKGVLNDDPGRKKKSNVVVRTGCKVLVRVKQVSNQWKITCADLEHNHPLAPSLWLVRFMKCHKNMSPCEKSFIKILQSSRVPPRQVMSIFRMLRGHLRAVGFDAKDVTNSKCQESIKRRNRDINELIELFRERQQKIPGFYYSLQTDKDDTVRSVFWPDAVGRANYKVFGDYVSFDTTFSTNVYDMPFAPIVGVDNHGNTILFGCALLKDQTAPTYEWLFESFLIANGRKMPTTIITDQEQAIGNAIESKFETAVRRFCYWHILELMKKKQYPYFKARKGLYSGMKRAIKDSFTPAEFERRCREENALSKLDRCRYTSDVKDPNLFSHIALERHASSIYTNAIFRKMQVEFKRSTAYGVTEIIRERVFEVRKRSEYKDPEFRKDIYTVEVNESKDVFVCSCRKLDRDGIHCCHVLKIAERMDLLEFPDSFVRRRWTKAIDNEVSLAAGQTLVIGGSKATDAIQYCIMMADISNFCSSIAGDKRFVELFMTEFAELKKRVADKIKGDDTSQNQNNSVAQEVREGGVVQYKDPPRVIKSKASAKRKLPIGEKIANQMKAKEAKLTKAKTPAVKKCTKCKSTTHDRKSCPELGKAVQLPQAVHKQSMKVKNVGANDGPTVAPTMSQGKNK
ncbi:unnamed protein product [Urochloa decumbens]|uniref:SWIM-type domain-containing protein n=1 Tax=Urochloa decumbens TaxID=240449 RepID=A0ABC9EGF4_9POAL